VVLLYDGGPGCAAERIRLGPLLGTIVVSAWDYSGSLRARTGVAVPVALVSAPIVAQNQRVVGIVLSCANAPRTPVSRAGGEAIMVSCRFGEKLPVKWHGSECGF